MLAALRRHPIPIRAFFRHSLVLTYAFPEALLAPLLPDGLALDTHEGCGFLAIALVQTQSLRPVGLPAFLGRDFFLSGYRIFSRYRRADGRTLRGLRILRSDADSRLMVAAGNLLTHYRYRKCVAACRRTPQALEIEITTPHAEADLAVRAELAEPATAPPEGSPFADLQVARRFAGPLPFTFDSEPGCDGMVLIEGVREHWHPTPVRVHVSRCTFLQRPPFDAVAPRLANAFLIENVPYRWKRGVLAPLAAQRA
ncbi:MAG TPA: DUF2071 domain-containing protein [Planctomycetota bacterium]|nr:DUF2071 domain-containing protein [Planctomycetota bacterium]